MEKKMQIANEDWMNDTRKVAVRLRRKGYSLIPLAPSGNKKPCKQLLPTDDKGDARWSLLRDNPADEKMIRDWFKQTSRCNIGVITGKESGLVALDIDGPIPPDLLAILPDTVTTKTVRDIGGYHFWFRHEGGLPTYKDKWRWEDDGMQYQIEIKAQGRYVVSPPSTAANHRTYEWLEGKSPFDRRPAELPLDLFTYLQSKDSTRPVGERSQKSIRRVKPRLEEERLWFEDLETDEEVAIQIMAACECQVDGLGKAFICPLHDERHPSAALWRREYDVIQLRDFHERDGIWWYSLPHVYASYTTKKRLISFPEDWHEPWWARALHESGCVKEPLPDIPGIRNLPINTPEAAVRFYENLCYGLKLKRMLYPKGSLHGFDEYYFFPARFAAVWYGVGPNTYENGKWWLIDSGYIEEAVIEEIVLGKRGDLFPPERGGRGNRGRYFRLPE